METKRYADIIAFDREEKPALVVEVKARPLVDRQEVQRSQAQLTEYLRLMPAAVHYAMLVDSRKVRVYRWDGQRLPNPAATLDTAQALTPYEPDYGQKPIYEHYLIGLVEAWLRDIAYHWKLSSPPYAVEIAEIGLAGQLAGGTTRSEAALSA